MTNKKAKIQKISTRRATLKRLLTGTGSVLAVKAAPDEWIKPMVESVVLPSHAQTSSFGYTSLGFANAVNQDGILNILLPRARAVTKKPLVQVEVKKNICINYSGGNAEVQVAFSNECQVYTGSFKLPFTRRKLFPDGDVDAGFYILLSGELSEDGNQIFGEIEGCSDDDLGEYIATKSSASCQLTAKTEIKCVTKKCI